MVNDKGRSAAKKERNRAERADNSRSKSAQAQSRTPSSQGDQHGVSHATNPVRKIAPFSPRMTATRPASRTSVNAAGLAQRPPGTALASRSNYQGSAIASSTRAVPSSDGSESSSGANVSKKRNAAAPVTQQGEPTEPPKKRNKTEQGSPTAPNRAAQSVNHTRVNATQAFPPPPTVTTSRFEAFAASLGSGLSRAGTSVSTNALPLVRMTGAMVLELLRRSMRAFCAFLVHDADYVAPPEAVDAAIANHDGGIDTTMADPVQNVAPTFVNAPVATAPVSWGIDMPAREAWPRIPTASPEPSSQGTDRGAGPENPVLVRLRQPPNVQEDRWHSVELPNLAPPKSHAHVDSPELSIFSTLHGIPSPTFPPQSRQDRSPIAFQTTSQNSKRYNAPQTVFKGCRSDMSLDGEEYNACHSPMELSEPGYSFSFSRSAPVGRSVQHRKHEKLSPSQEDTPDRASGAASHQNKVELQLPTLPDAMDFELTQPPPRVLRQTLLQQPAQAQPQAQQQVQPQQPVQTLLQAQAQQPAQTGQADNHVDPSIAQGNLTDDVQPYPSDNIMDVDEMDVGGEETVVKDAGGEETSGNGQPEDMGENQNHNGQGRIGDKVDEQQGKGEAQEQQGEDKGEDGSEDGSWDTDQDAGDGEEDAQGDDEGQSDGEEGEEGDNQDQSEEEEGEDGESDEQSENEEDKDGESDEQSEDEENEEQDDNQTETVTKNNEGEGEAGDDENGDDDAEAWHDEDEDQEEDTAADPTMLQRILDKARSTSSTAPSFGGYGAGTSATNSEVSVGSATWSAAGEDMSRFSL